MMATPTQTQPKTPNIYVSDVDLERYSHEINLLLGCASFLACNVTQDAKRRLVDILVVAERRAQELTLLIQDAKYKANTPPVTSRRRGRK